MRTFTRLLPAIAALSATLLLGACATEPARQADISPQPSDAPARRAAPAAKIDWPALHKELAAALRDVADTEVGEPTVDGFSVRIPVNNGFASGSAEPRPALTRVLDSVVAPLATRPAVAVRIVGHTDSQGSEMYNLQLSIRRAEAVMEYLRSRGLALDRLTADGKGEMEPIADNAKEATRARNRRVELILRPLP